MISPLLANIYLHYCFDLWAERWRWHEARGDMIVVRYADDLVAGFEHESDARRFLDAMRDRLGKFALSLHPDKTRLPKRRGSGWKNLARPGTSTHGLPILLPRPSAGTFWRLAAALAISRTS